MTILITGINGALGISTALKARQLGHEVRGFGRNSFKRHIPRSIDYIEGDMLDKELLREALKGIDVIMHFASLTGFREGLSDYVRSNILGTTVLLDLIREEKLPIKKLIFASSSSVYGEGTYECPFHGKVFPPIREIPQLEEERWNPLCPACQADLNSLPTMEDKKLSNTHIYAITKQVAEKIIHEFAKVYDITAVSLRFPILYGPNQYKGIVPLFSSKIIRSEEVSLTEDGRQIRDFIFIEDASDSVFFSLEHINKSGIFNISVSKPVSLLSLIEIIGKTVGVKPKKRIMGGYRVGDIRHIYLDNSRIIKLGYHPNMSIEDGILRYMDWKKKEKSYEKT